ncbi:MAG TPA: hypothetical protein DCP90_03870 [Clostridiales bacterium]|nr:MAG: hypothetical protein A2Y22_04015 [Clostridiales bacterium GWD2_32_59]HAN09733.1 hypothetical protein [Clostridiales bacterium]
MCKRIIGVVLLIGIMLNNSVSASGIFTDVKEGDWYHKGVNRLVEIGIVDGYEDGTFRPDDGIQADQFIKMVIVGLGYNEIENGSEYWASEYMKKARELKILKADDFAIYHGNYDYTRAITREEMATVIFHALIGKEATIADSQDAQKAYATLIKEYSILTDTTKTQITEVYAKGILTGYPDRYFKPYRTLTRAEATTVILRLVDPSERAIVVKPTKTINDVENADNENTVKLPKNKADFYRINPEMPVELYEYEYNQKARYDMDYFMTNRDLYNDLVYKSSYGGTGRQVLTKIKGYAKEYLDSVYNMDYTKDSVVIRDAIRYHITDSYAMQTYIDNIVQQMKGNKIVSIYEVLTDDSLVYQDQTGDIRIRGKFKIMYLSNTSGKAIMMDYETNKLHSMPIELNKWYEQDFEIKFANAFGQALWNRTEFTVNSEITIE